jgi:hypothetical protein
MRPLEVFLSHSSEDGEVATRIALALRNCGIPTFFSPTNIRGAQQWQDEILGALDRCDWFVVLLSRNSVNSMWVKRETAYALAEPRYENKIVPLIYGDCDLGPLAWLKLYQMIDFRGGFDDSCRNLLRIWDVDLE